MTNLLKLSVKQKDKESADHIANMLHFRHSRYINSQIKVFNALALDMDYFILDEKTILA